MYNRSLIIDCVCEKFADKRQLLAARAIVNPSKCPLPGAAFNAPDTGVEAVMPIASDIGVVALVGTWLLLCAICAWTRWPAARALQRLSSPARTLAAIILASRRAFSPGWLG